MIKIINVCGARPNFMKIAPLMRAYRQYDHIQPTLIHTGQHYDDNMSDLFFRQLEIPSPDLNLEVGSASHAVQTAEIILRFEPVLLERKPDWVVVVGDVNSTIACALTAVKLGIKVAHVEAGLRSFDRGMPEEINRILTDALSELLFVSEPSGLTNLAAEGIPDERIHFVGNVMIDTLRANLEKARTSKILERLDLTAGAFNVVTLHRPNNVDDAAAFGRIADALDVIQRDLPTVFPMHPRTRSNLSRLDVGRRLDGMRQLRIIEPLGYLDFLRLMADAAVVLTDSGGIQEETTILGVGCLTLRASTERPITLTQGTNALVGSDTEAIISGYRRWRSRPVTGPQIPEKWDGRASDRIAAILAAR